MNSKEQTPNSKLQKSSIIFMQLGLILALLVVYVTLEHKSLIKYAAIEEAPIIIDPEPWIPPTRPVIKRKKVKKIKTETKTPSKVTNDVEVIDNNEQKTEDLEDKLFDQDTDTGQSQDDDFNFDDIPVDDEDIDESVPFAKIEQKPIFPGCKGNNKQLERCFNKKMAKHINKNFNPDIVTDLGLSSGQKRINVQFLIDKQGNIIDIKSSSPYLKLQKEGERVVKLLPKMTPGKQRNKPVPVRFNQSIVFNID